MSRAARMILGTVLAVLVAVIILFRLAARPYTFEGKRMEQWFEDYEKGNPQARERAQAVLTQIARERKVHLSREMQASDSPLKQKFLELTEHQSLIRIGTASDERAKAYHELELLGPGAREMIPTLAELLNQGENPYEVAMALAKIVPEGIVPLTRALTHANELVRSSATSALGKLGEKGGDSVPALIQCLKDPNYSVRIYAAIALGEIHQRPLEAVPALISALNDRDITVRRRSARALGAFGEGAHQAVPDLVRIVNGRDAVARDMAKESLRAIDPATGAAMADK